SQLLHCTRQKKLRLPWRALLARPRAQSSRRQTIAEREFCQSAIKMGRRLESLEEFGIDVVLERRHGVRASVLRGILYALSFVYDRLLQLRPYLFCQRVLLRRGLGLLVICIC